MNHIRIIKVAAAIEFTLVCAAAIVYIVQHVTIS